MYILRKLPCASFLTE